MKTKFLAYVAVASFAALGAVPSVAQYNKQGVRFLSQIPLSGFQGNQSSGAGGSGYVSPSGREYGIIGLRNGQAIVDITNPTTPQTISYIPGASTLWHESAVKGDYAYLVSDSSGVGVQVVDLRNADQGQAPLLTTFTGSGLSTVHTAQASPVTNTIFLNGSNLANGGLVALNVNNPAAPTIAGTWSSRYVHDCWVVQYTSGQWAGREICFACCGTSGLYIIDVTNKAAMTTIGSINYQGRGYCHSGQLTNDKKYFLINDEFDEGNGTYNSCSTVIIDVQNLNSPQFAGVFSSGVQSIDHNSNLLPNNYMVLAAYREGVRIYDVTNPFGIKETGFFDTYPGGTGFSYDGDWGLWSFFPSGNIILTDINRGLFVLDPSEAMGLGAVPMDMVVEKGSLVSGGYKDVRKSDDVGPVITSTKFQITELSTSSVVIGYQTTYSPAAFIDLQLEAKVNKMPTGPIDAYLKNWSSGQFVKVATWTPTLNDQVFNLNGITGTAYVNASGRIELRLVASGTNFVADDEFQVRYDQAKVTVRRS